MTAASVTSAAEATDTDSDTDANRRSAWFVDLSRRRRTADEGLGSVDAGGEDQAGHPPVYPPSSIAVPWERSSS